jgi:hypothetical protein
MAIRTDKTTAHLEGVCGAEEALELLEWLRGRKAPKLDLKACEHLHTSVLQVLLALRPRLVAPPAEPFLAAWVTPLLTEPR